MEVFSNICHRHSTSHHPDIDTYNENEEPRTLTYHDANSLYSWAMSQMLPLRSTLYVYSNSIDSLTLTFLKFNSSIFTLYVSLFSTPIQCCHCFSSLYASAFS